MMPGIAVQWLEFESALKRIHIVVKFLILK